MSELPSASSLLVLVKRKGRRRERPLISHLRAEKDDLELTVFLSLFAVFPGAGLARYIASFGYDWILVDCEHGNISYVLSRWKLYRHLKTRTRD